MTAHWTPSLSRRAAMASFAAAVAAGGASACGSSSTGTSSGNVEFWSQLAGSKKQAGTDLADAFTASNPDIALKTAIYGSPDQLNQKLLTGFVGGIVPDLFIQHWDYSLIYASGDKLVPMGDRLQAAGVDQKFVGYTRSGEKSVTAPLYGTARALTINADLVTAAGLDPATPPQSWDEVREWAQRMTKWDGSQLEVAGLHVYANDLELFEIFTLLVQGAGGSILNEARDDVAFDSEAGLAAARFLKTLIVDDRVTVPGFGIGDSSSAPFPSGRAAFAVNGNYGLNAADEAKINLVVSPMPGQDSGFTSLLDPFCFAIPDGSDSRDAASTFVDFALQYDQQVAFATTSRNIPALTDALSDPQVLADKALAAFAEAASYAPDSPPATPAFSRMYQTVSRQLQNVFFGRTDPEAAIETAASTARIFVQEGAE